MEKTGKLKSTIQAAMSNIQNAIRLVPDEFVFSETRSQLYSVLSKIKNVDSKIKIVENRRERRKSQEAQSQIEKQYQNNLTENLFAIDQMIEDEKNKLNSILQKAVQDDSLLKG